MTYLRRTLHACAFVAVGAAGFFAPDAAAFVNAATDPVPPSVTNTESASVMVLLPQSTGSGVAIGGGAILTAAHVVGDEKQVTIKSRDGAETPAEVLWASKAYDIALVKTDHAIPSATIDCKSASVGDAIMTVGNPLGMQFISTYGKIAGEPREMGPWKTVFVTDLTVIMGNSGGPVFSGGKLVGIAVGVLGVPEENGAKSYLGLSTVVPSSVVCSLMGRVE